ncbi:hypothetical protein ABW20_dc0107524 [Dactylellina cionopaga]|nr:hypothetical protein ABW20_dc0107524 [Dactylellina cionopaga]
MSTEEKSTSADVSNISNKAQNFSSNNRQDGEGEAGESTRTEEEYAQSSLTLRAIVSSKEAGVIIGKAGKNVADLRDETGVKAGVSKVVPGVHDRVLTVTGNLDGVAKAYAMVAQTLVDSPPGAVPTTPMGTHPVRLLISHNQMGTIIGRSGLKIKHIQDVSGVRMVAQKEMLPQSTERIVEVQGSAEGIRQAVWEIGKCLVDDWQRGTGTILYNPATEPRASTSSASAPSPSPRFPSDRSSRGPVRTGNGTDFSEPTPSTENGDIQTQNISIPADMSNEKALYLLYENLEAEKMRRSQGSGQD